MKPRVLLIDDDPVYVDDLLYHIGEHYEFRTRTSGNNLLSHAEEFVPDVILLDIELGSGPDGLEILSLIRESSLRVPVIMVSRHEARDKAPIAWRRGAFGYIEKGARIDELAAQIEAALREATVIRENEILREEIASSSGPIIGQSEIIQKLRDQIEKVAQSDSTVLLTGETGTGKGVVAGEIHAHSARKDRLFLKVDCPATPDSMFEAELFGHEKGAFTGATSRRIGKFEHANHGTLFLDEIGELNGALQAKLLRVVQDQTITRLGSNNEIDLDVRLIAATNRNLQEEVKRGSFREDLFYRLRVAPIEIPPLRERREDIPLLAQFFLDRLSRRMKRGQCILAAAARDRLLAWDWPGNVRELQAVLENAMNHASGPTLDEDLFVGLVGPGFAHLTLDEARDRVVARFERDYIHLLLSSCDGNLSEAARRMGYSREGLRKLMKRRGIERPTDPAS